MLHRLPAPLVVMLLTSGAVFLSGCRTLGDMARAESLGICGLLHLAVAVWALINIIGSNASTGSKVIWALVVWLLPVLGLIIWFFAGPRKR